MVRLFLLAIGFFFVVVGFWQYRHPERTQEIAMKGARHSWQRRIFGSEGYLVGAATNGIVLLAIGCAILLFVVADLVIGVLL